MSNNFQNLGQSVQVYTMLQESTVGDTDCTGLKILDLAEWNNVMFVASLRGVVNTARFGMKFYHGDSSGSMVLCDGATAYYSYSSALVASDNDYQSMILDVVNPKKRWGSVYIDRATAVSEPTVLAICYNPRRAPITSDTGTCGSIVAPVIAVTPSS